jgi:hypothetical protein
LRDRLSMLLKFSMATSSEEALDSAVSAHALLRSSAMAEGYRAEWFFTSVTSIWHQLSKLSLLYFNPRVYDHLALKVFKP